MNTLGASRYLSSILQDLILAKHYSYAKMLKHITSITIAILSLNPFLATAAPQWSYPELLHGATVRHMCGVDSKVFYPGTFIIDVPHNTCMCDIHCADLPFKGENDMRVPPPYCPPNFVRCDEVYAGKWDAQLGGKERREKLYPKPGSHLQSGSPDDWDGI